MNDVFLASDMKLKITPVDLDQAPVAAAHGEMGGMRDGGFGRSLEQILHRVDAKEQDANAKVNAVELGESDDMVGAMLASQDANLSFSMLMQVRNKVVGAVDELIKLQL
jgi:flagellar hook-basal body complex protein FliE